MPFIPVRTVYFVVEPFYLTGCSRSSLDPSVTVADTVFGILPGPLLITAFTVLLFTLCVHKNLWARSCSCSFLHLIESHVRARIYHNVLHQGAGYHGGLFALLVTFLTLVNVLQYSLLVWQCASTVLGWDVTLPSRVEILVLSSAALLIVRTKM